MILHLDFETRSTVDLKAAGLDNYARHPDTDVWCMAYAFGDEEPLLWEPWGKFCWLDLDDTTILVAHNARFEMAIWNNIMTKRYGFPDIKPDRWRCTMAMA
jgi:DNA polymerase